MSARGFRRLFTVWQVNVGMVGPPGHGRPVDATACAWPSEVRGCRRRGILESLSVLPGRSGVGGVAEPHAPLCNVVTRRPTMHNAMGRQHMSRHDSRRLSPASRYKGSEATMATALALRLRARTPLVFWRVTPRE